MKKILCFLFLRFLFFSPVCFSQTEDFKTRYNREVIGFYGSYRFIKNDIVMTKRQIKPFLRKYSYSAVEFDMYVRRQRISNILGVVGTGAYIGSLYMLTRNPRQALGLFLGSTVIVGISIPVQLQAYKNLQRALFNYNREVLAEP